MAVQAAAALLDELMGRNRNSLPNEKPTELNWEDPDVCKYHLVKFCPHELFVNTKADLGPCLKLHDDELKTQYDKAVTYKKQIYEDEFVRFCQSMLNDVEKKIKKGKQRLSLAQKGDMPLLTPAQQLRNEEQISLLSDKINRLVAEAEQQGTEGKVEQAQGLMKLCDQLKEEREQLRRQVENSHWQQTAEMAAAQEKQMEVCEICGAFLIVGDAQQRIDDHLMGKQHMGYARLKVTVEEIMDNRQKAKEERDRKRDEERKERDKHRMEDDRRREERGGEGRRWGGGSSGDAGEKSSGGASVSGSTGDGRGGDRGSGHHSSSRRRGRSRSRSRDRHNRSGRSSRSPSKNKHRRRSRSRSRTHRKRGSHSRDRDRHKDRRSTNGERRPFGPSPSRFGSGEGTLSSSDVATRLMQLANGGLGSSSEGGSGGGSAGGNVWGSSAGHSTSE